jgi:hypothetical protein
MSEDFWAVKYKSKPVRLNLGDLTVQRLREMKRRFGTEYGIPTEFISLLLRGDMDALACAVWIGQQKNGGEIEDPREMDFSLDDFEAIEDPKPVEKKAKGKKAADPTTAEGSPSTDSASGASKTSELDTSSTSETSSA